MPLDDFTGWHITGSSVTLLFLFSNLLLSIFYCIPEYCRLKYFPVNLPPVARVDSALSWGCPVAAACATSQGRWAQVESLGDWLQLPGVFLSVTMTDGLYCEVELHLQACPVLRSRVEGGEPPFPTVTAVFSLGFDKCYQLLQTKHPQFWNFSPYFCKRKYWRFVLHYFEFLKAKFSDMLQNALDLF